jgi:hypothetical protein
LRGSKLGLIGLIGIFISATRQTYSIAGYALFFRRRHQPRRPALAKIRPGSPAPATGPGTALGPVEIVAINPKR